MKNFLGIIFIIISVVLIIVIAIKLFKWLIPKILEAMSTMIYYLCFGIVKFFQFLLKSLWCVPILFLFFAVVLHWDAEKNLPKLIIGLTTSSLFVLAYDIWLLHRKKPTIEKWFNRMKSKLNLRKKETDNLDDEISHSSESTYYQDGFRSFDDADEQYKANGSEYQKNATDNNTSNDSQSYNDESKYNNAGTNYVPPKCFQILKFSYIPCEADLKKRYRELAKRTHPDINGGDGAHFAKINEAYHEALKYYQ